MNDAVGFDCHDHASCIDTAMLQIDERCATEKLNLTPVRRRVMEILLQEHRALGAYDILERLREEGLGSQPPVAYRALDFLIEHGFAHRVERLNAFVACVHPGDDHVPTFLICSGCNAVAETQSPSVLGAVRKAGAAVGFEVTQVVIEAEGRCPSCQTEGAAA